MQQWQSQAALVEARLRSLRDVPVVLTASAETNMAKTSASADMLAFK